MPRLEPERDYLHERIKLTDGEDGPITLSMWATSRRDGRGQTIIGYELNHGPTNIFRGEDFAGSPLSGDDSDGTMGALLGFLSLRIGDTDSEYFDDYTAAQRAFSESYGEELGLLAHDLEHARVHCLDDLLQSDEYDSSRFGSNSDDAISDSERWARVQEAAESGSSGSTHAEILEDQRKCLSECFELPEMIVERIEAEIREVEEWHESRGTLDQDVSAPAPGTAKLPKVEELEWVFFSEPNTTIDVVHPVTGRGVYSDRTLEEFREEHPNTEMIHIDEAVRRQEAHYRTAPVKISKEDFEQALNVLPPVEWTTVGDVETFKMSERVSGAITGIYCRIAEQHFCFNDQITLRHEEIEGRCRPLL